MFRNEEKYGGNREVLHKAIFVHLHKRKLLSPSLSRFFLSLELHSHCFEILWIRRVLVLLISFFQRRNKTKTTSFIKHRKETLLQTLSHKSSVSGKRTNLKTSISRKQRTPNFSKNEHFLPSDTHTHVFAYQGVRNVRLSENLAWFILLKHPF